MKNVFDENTRRLILAAEIAGYLHDSRRGQTIQW